MVGDRAHYALGVEPDALAVGKTIIFEGEELLISGHFAAPGSVFASELWLPLEQLMALTQRENISCVVVRMQQPDPGAVAFFLATYDRELVAISEHEYYSRLGDFYRPVVLMAWVAALLIAGAALFGGVNTLYAAFQSRQAEYAALEAMGFRRWMLALSMAQETLLV